MYYKYYDSEAWESPLLRHLAQNEPLPTTLAGSEIPLAVPGQLSNFKVIDNLGSFGMKNYDTMEEIWKEVNRTNTVEVTTQNLEAVRPSILAGDVAPKSSRRSKM